MKNSIINYRSPVLFILLILFDPIRLSAQLISDFCQDPNTTAGNVEPIYSPGTNQPYYVTSEEDLENTIADLSQDAVGWDGISDYAMVVTYQGPDNGEIVDCIQGVSYNGIFDFTNPHPNGSIYPEGVYKFWGLGYYAADIPPIGESLILKILYPCLDSVLLINEVLDCFLSIDTIANDTACITMPEVLTIVNEQLPALGFEICLVVEESPYEIHYRPSEAIPDLKIIDSYCDLNCVQSEGSIEIKVDCAIGELTYFDDSVGNNPSTTLPQYDNDGATTVYYACVESGFVGNINSISSEPELCEPDCEPAVYITAACPDESVSAGFIEGPTKVNGAIFAFTPDGDRDSMQVNLNEDLTGVTGPEDYLILVSKIENDGEEILDCIKGYTSNGVFPLDSLDVFGDPYADGIYRFSGIAYDVNEIIEFCNDSSVQEIEPCAIGISTMEELIDCWINSHSCLTVTEIFARYNEIYAAGGVSVCMAVVEEPYEIAYCASSTSCFLGISDFELPDLQLFPNPVSDQLMIESNMKTPSELRLQVFDLQGNLLLTEFVTPTSGRKLCVIETRELAEGNYLLRLVAENYSQTKRFQVVR